MVGLVAELKDIGHPPDTAIDKTPTADNDTKALFSLGVSKPKNTKPAEAPFVTKAKQKNNTKHMF